MMAKIIRLKTGQDNLVEALTDILEMAKSGELSNFVFAGKCPNGEVVSAWAKADFGERNELMGHIQADIMYAMIEANMDRLVERL